MNLSRRQFLQLLGTLPAAAGALSLAPAVLAKQMPDVLLEEKSPIERVGFLFDQTEQSLEVERINWDIRNEYAKAARTDGSLWIGPLVSRRCTLHALTYDARAPQLFDVFNTFQIMTLNLHLRHSPEISYRVEGYLTQLSAMFDERVSFNFDMELVRLLYQNNL